MKHRLTLTDFIVTAVVIFLILLPMTSLVSGLITGAVNPNF